MRNDLLQRTRLALARGGFFVSQETKVRPVSFDLVARRDGQLLLFKVLTNVDSLTEAAAHELRVLAEFLDASPILVGERSSSRPLEDGAVYARHGVPIMTIGTFEAFILEGVPPLVFAAPGGFYVKVDGERLRRIREERGVSLGQLAEAAGVSRRAISMYEEGMGAMVEVAERIEAFLDEALIEPVDPFRMGAAPKEVVVDLERLQAGIQLELLRMMASVGFRVAPVEKGPFQGVAAARENRDEGVILTGVSETAPELARSAAAVANLCEVTETFGAFFVKARTTRLHIEGLPLVGMEELGRLDEPADVIALIEERRPRKRDAR